MLADQANAAAYAKAPPPRSRAAHRAAREAAILRAALRCFAERGYDGARIEDIAENAQIGKGTLYVYFASKQALLEGVVRAALGPGLAALEAVSARDAEDPRIALRAIVAQAREALRHPDAAIYMRVLVAEAGRTPEVSAIVASEILTPVLKAVSRVIARGAAAGAFRPVDADVAARLLLAPALFAGLGNEASGFTEPGELEALLSAHADLFLSGLRPV